MQKSKIKSRSIVLFYGGLSLVSLLWIWIGNLPVRFFGIGGVVPSFLIGFLVVALSLISTDKTQWAQKLEAQFAKLLVPLSFYSIFLIALLSSVGEELFFRGAIQNQFGLIIASLSFGLVHLPLTKELVPWTLMAIVMGFVLGGLYHYSGYLLAPILLHFTINFLNLWLLNQKFLNHNSF